MTIVQPHRGTLTNAESELCPPSGAILEYAIRYGDELIRDPSFRCVADVIDTFHAAYTDERRRVTGVLMRRIDGGEWEQIA